MNKVDIWGQEFKVNFSILTRLLMSILRAWIVWGTGLLGENIQVL